MAHLAAPAGIELVGRNAALLLAPFIALSAAPGGSAAPSILARGPLPTVRYPLRAKSKQSPVRSRSAQRRSIGSGPVQPPEAQTPTQAPKGRKHHQPSKPSPCGHAQGDVRPAAEIRPSAAGRSFKHVAGSLAKPQKDIPVAEFRAALQEADFIYLKQSGLFVDRRHRTARRSFLPVTDARGRLLRRETLAALKAWRAEHEASVAANAALQRRRIDLAGRLAPKALSPCRADLTDAAAIAQLADDFLTRVAGFGSVEFKALIQMGWSAAQLREHGDAARAVADRKAVPA